MWTLLVFQFFFRGGGRGGTAREVVQQEHWGLNIRDFTARELWELVYLGN